MITDVSDVTLMLTKPSVVVENMCVTHCLLRAKKRKGKSTPFGVITGASTCNQGQPGAQSNTC